VKTILLALATANIQIPKRLKWRGEFALDLLLILLCAAYIGVISQRISENTMDGWDAASAFLVFFLLLPFCLAEFGLKYAGSITIAGDRLSPSETCSFWLHVLAGQSPPGNLNEADIKILFKKGDIK
jgi:hypothetical protein